MISYQKGGDKCLMKLNLTRKDLVIIFISYLMISQNLVMITHRRKSMSTGGTTAKAFKRTVTIHKQT